MGPARAPVRGIGAARRGLICSEEISYPHPVPAQPCWVLGRGGGQGGRGTLGGRWRGRGGLLPHGGSPCHPIFLAGTDWPISSPNLAHGARRGSLRAVGGRVDGPTGVQNAVESPVPPPPSPPGSPAGAHTGRLFVSAAGLQTNREAGHEHRSLRGPAGARAGPWTAVGVGGRECSAPSPCAPSRCAGTPSRLHAALKRNEGEVPKGRRDGSSSGAPPFRPRNNGKPTSGRGRGPTTHPGPTHPPVSPVPPPSLPPHRPLTR